MYVGMHHIGWGVVMKGEKKTEEKVREKVLPTELNVQKIKEDEEVQSIEAIIDESLCGEL